MRILSAAALVLMVAACSRTGTAPHATAVPAVQPAPAATVGVPAVATIPTSKARKPAATAKRKASAAGSKSASSHDDDSRWVDVDPESLQPRVDDNDPALLEFREEQEQRDRELLERDAAEANTRERYEDRSMDELPPPVYDEPPMEDDYPPEDDLEGRYPPDEENPPPGYDDYPPEDEFRP